MGAEEFYTLDALDPHCTSCASKIAYGETTTYDDDAKAHTCNACGAIIK